MSGRSAPGRRAGRRRPLQVLVEEFQDRAVALDLVLLLREAVTLVGEDDVLDGDSVSFYSRDDVVGLRLDDARVVRALKDEQRPPDLVRVEDG